MMNWWECNVLWEFYFRINFCLSIGLEIEIRCFDAEKKEDGAEE